MAMATTVLRCFFIAISIAWALGVLLFARAARRRACIMGCMQFLQRIARMLTTLLSSRRFGVGVLAFFVFEALWVTFSALYPMAFDEDFHFGLIKLYSHH